MSQVETNEAPCLAKDGLWYSYAEMAKANKRFIQKRMDDIGLTQAKNEVSLASYRVSEIGSN